MRNAAASSEMNVYILQTPLADDRDSDGQQLCYVDFSSGKVRITPDCSYPVVDNMRLAGDRYLIGFLDDELFVLDANRPKSATHSIAASAGVEYVSEVKNANRFYTSAVKANGKGEITLFEIDSAGKPQVLEQWPAATSGTWTPVDVDEHSIFSLSSDLSEIEVRDLQAGTVQQPITIPSEFDAKNQGVELISGAITQRNARDEAIYFDLTRRDWIPKPQALAKLYDVSPDRNLYSFYTKHSKNESTFEVYDWTQGKVTTRFRTTGVNEMIRIDDQRYADFSDEWGYSIRVRAIPDGQTLRLIQPYRWLALAAIALVASYFAWSFLWMRFSARAGTWAVVDVVLVLGIPALMLLIRFLLRGDVYRLDRVPQRQAFGIIMAAQMLAMTWVVFGKTRPTLRFLPTVALTTMILALLAFVFGDRHWIVWHVAKISIAPAVCLAAILGLMRLLRFHVDQSDATKEASSSPLTGARFPLRDLILITIIAAATFAAARPVMDAVKEVFFVNTELLIPLMHAVLLAWGTVVIALIPNRRAFVLGVIVILAGSVYVTLDPIVAFAQGRPTWRSGGDPYLQAPIVGAIALFAGLIPFRWRGWRLSRSRRAVA